MLDYVLKLENVKGDFDRFVSLSAEYSEDELTDAMLDFKTQLLTKLPVWLGNFKNNMLINVIDSDTGRVDLVFDGMRQDVYIKAVIYKEHKPPYTVTLLYGNDNASSVDSFSFNTESFNKMVASPAKYAILTYTDAIIKLLDDCWNEQVMTENRIKAMAKTTAIRRANLKAKIEAREAREAEARQQAEAAKATETEATETIEEEKATTEVT